MGLPDGKTHLTLQNGDSIERDISKLYQCASSRYLLDNQSVGVEELGLDGLR